MAPAPSYAHLAALTDHRGIFEHADHATPRRHHGYCVDDVARALILVVREPDQTPELHDLAEIYLTFLESALQADGRFHNRMSESGAFADAPGVGDWWGRGVWAFGHAASYAHDAGHRDRAAVGFDCAASARSPALRSMAFAGLGAAARLDGDSADARARALLEDAVEAVRDSPDPAWPWPEPRLRYANGALPDLLLGAGAALSRPDLVDRGLRMLRFLLDLESAGGHLSVAGVGGRGPEENHPVFDQQPIEVAALGEACFRAFEITGDPAWLVGVESAWGWFAGRNDAGVAMFDETVGSGYDGLEPDGRNENRGAESTIAALMTYQLARRAGVLE